MFRSIWTRLGLAAALLSLSLAPSATALHAAAPATALPSPEALSSILRNTRKPAHDFLSLAARLKLHTTTPIDPIVNARPVDYAVGSTTHFYIFSGGTASAYTLQPAVLAYKTAHAYFYVQQGLPVDTRKLAQEGQNFEAHIYPTDHNAFGTEWTPGIDNDKHVTIFISLGFAPGYAGYFYSEDLFPRSVNAYTNARKMIYMNAGTEEPGSPSFGLTLAHEFQHMIHFNMHPGDDGWINEGTSVLAQVLNGYGSDGWETSKFSVPDSQLNYWDEANNALSYGGGYLWMLYLYEHFGGDRATRAELDSPGQSNMPLFNTVLAKLGSKKSADDVFADWTIANFLNDHALANGRYGYTHTTQHMQPTSQLALPFSAQFSMHHYAANYLDIPATGGKAITLHFSGQPTTQLLSTTTPPQGFWWSNRGDGIDTTLTTPAIDLRSKKHATLQYQAWYDLENGYDYGYVEVSADGGKTWYAQRTAHTTSYNPNGNALAVGYTGSSCGTGAAQGCWVSEHVDLSPYAGKQILVRFEQVTDDVYNQQGLAIAHIQVPEANFDGDAVAGGWQSTGWVHAENTLSQHWIVQAIVYGLKSTTVVPMTVGTDGKGTLHIPAGSSRIVVAVSPVAPLTTVTTSYAISGGA